MKLHRVAALPVLVLLTFVASQPAIAQQQPSAAPVPAAIFSAKTVFISNTSGQSWLASNLRDLAYNEFYAAMKDWGRYQLVSSPADADLVIEIRLAYSTSSARSLRATVRDPKTRTILWAFTENDQSAARAATDRKNFDQAMAAVVADLKGLAGSAGSATQP
jgi:hypothetical protein